MVLFLSRSINKKTQKRNKGRGSQKHHHQHTCMHARYMQPVKSNQISVAVKNEMSQQKRPAEGDQKKRVANGRAYSAAQLLVVDNNPAALISWDFSMAADDKFRRYLGQYTDTSY